MKRVLVVADRSLVAHAVPAAVSQTPGFQLVGVIDARTDMHARLIALHPDLIVVDDMRNRHMALSCLREAAASNPSTDTVLLTSDMSEAWLDDAFEAGADTVISTRIEPAALGTLLREVAHRRMMNRPRARRRTPGEVAPVDCPLTTRELEILVLAAEGMTNAKIAGRLWITQQTVKFHLSNTYRKLGVANRTQACRYAYVNALVRPDEPLAA
jgi:DNA-binding NarL/FixJ family response regulator